MICEHIIRIIMKTWLRLLLVTATVGGGFSGILLTSNLLGSGGHGALQILILLLFMAMYAFVTVSGLMLVHDESRIWPVSTALALQIPWVSTPVMVYQFASGMHAAITLGTPEDSDRIGIHLGCNFLFGTHFQFRLGPYHETPSAFGVNAVALALFILLLRSRRYSRAGQSQRPRDGEVGAKLTGASMNIEAGGYRQP